LKKAIEQATITAPQDGLVMYAKVRGGRKIRVGDNISPWNPTIASLPDMSVLVSETYIEEIDITKIAINDNVEIVVDALPDQEFSGFVSGIANIGQELSGFESKVFQVIIELNQTNPELKPAMTTNNNIIINNISDVLTIPRQCLYSENGNDFVYIKRSGKIWKKIVSPGIENENEIVIESGLEEKDRILYSQPEKAEIIDFFDK
ncbi:MAG: HlyD family efflux transporter periplasmic adaptor subunit, partial [Prolixibacteraceae bacterium]|nr:HlyD family efflux transporter periplasmic adaptor subunit [Prolixibacteraceae bacterium]